MARLVLISGLGADPQSRSPYIRSRGRGELAVQEAFPNATIVRPGDALFGTLADLARLLPVLPLIGGGRTRLQPVYMEVVAEAVTRVLADPGTVGRTYELAGSSVYTLRDLVRFTLRVVGKRRLLIPVSFKVAEIQAWLLEFLPRPPLTTSQVDLLKADSVASEPCRVSRSSISGPEPSKMWCRPISAGRYAEYNVVKTTAVSDHRTYWCM